MLDLRTRLRFWSRVNHNGPVPKCNPALGKCFEWTGGLSPSGYGRFWCGTKGERAHRFSWFLMTGRWPKPFALHRCDNRKCVRFSHLFEGTHTDNMIDRARKGYAVRGEDHYAAKITNKQARQIRKAPANVPLIELARAYGISKANVCMIRRGKAWKAA